MTPGVRAVLGLVALLPLTSLVWFSVASYSTASDSAATARELEDLSEQARSLVALGSNLAFEGYYASAVQALEEFGLPSGMLVSVIGVDLVGPSRAAADYVDAVVAEANLEEIASSLAEVRSLEGQGPSAISVAYGGVALDTGQLVDDVLAEMDRLSAELGDSPALEEARSGLFLAVYARDTASVLINGSFGVRFTVDGEVPSEDALNLLIAGTQYLDSSAELDQRLDSDTQLAASWRELGASQELDVLTEEARRLGRQIAVGGVEAIDQVRFSVEGLSGLGAEGIQAEAQAFADSIAVLEAHVGLVDAATADLADAARDAGAEATSRQQTVMIVILVVALLVAAAVIVGSWWIVAPLLSMSRHVESIRSGDLSVRVAHKGPREVASAAEALNEATEHLRLAEAQVVALAAEELDNPVLTEEAPGKLGESLQDAVSRLTASLAEREQFRRKLAHEASHDGLTGLLNRAAVVTAIDQAIARTQRSGSELTVMIVDLDGFKVTNERYGQMTGDRVLRSAAKSIVAGVRDGDVVGRLGGDEFVVVAEAAGGPGEAVELARRVRAAVVDAVDVGVEDFEIDACVGLALASSGNLTADEMLRDADLGVYRAKEIGRGQVEVCDVELRKELAQRASTEAEIRTALAQDEFEVFYQTIHASSNLRPSSVEALVRWRRPDGSMRFPDSFIPIAERSDLIVGLDNAVIDQACRRLAQWRHDSRYESIRIAVNVSARHLTGGSLVGDIVERIERHSAPIARLGVEVTESSVLADLDGAARQLSQLRQMGVSVGIDDFGTGYTSLSHLRQLPFDVLKVDRSFVANVDRYEDRSLIKLIVDTGHTLGARIVAEGVETPSDVDALRKLKADYLQGFNFCKPVPPDEIERVIDASVEVATG